MTSREKFSIGFIIFVVAAIIISLLLENRDEDLYTNICERQGYTTLKISQYSRSTIWVCVDEDGVWHGHQEMKGIDE